MAPAGRTAFTEKDEDLLVKYLAEHGDTGRKGNHLYKQLCDNLVGLWPWASRHPWQSWRHRYMKNSDYFDRRIRKYQKQQSSSKQSNASSSKQDRDIESLSTDEETLQSPRKRKLNTSMDTGKEDKRRRVQSEFAEGKTARKGNVDKGKMPDRTAHGNARQQERARVDLPSKQHSGAVERSGHAVHSKVSGLIDHKPSQPSTSTSFSTERNRAPSGKKAKPIAPLPIEESSTEEEDDETPPPRLAPAAENDYSGQIFGSADEDDADAEGREMELDPEADENSSADDVEIDHMLTDRISAEEDLGRDIGDAHKDQGGKLYPDIETIKHPTTLHSNNVNPRKPPSFASTATSSTAQANSYYLKPKFVSRKMISESEKPSSDAHTTAADSGFFEPSSPSARNPASIPTSPQMHEIAESRRLHDSSSRTPTAAIKTLPKFAENPFGGNHLAGTKFKSLRGAAESEGSEPDSCGEAKGRKETNRAPIASVWPPVRNKKAAIAGSLGRDDMKKAERNRDGKSASSSSSSSTSVPMEALKSKLPNARETLQAGSTRKLVSETEDVTSRSVDKQKLADVKEPGKVLARRGSRFVLDKSQAGVAMADPSDGDDEEDVASESEASGGEANNASLFTQPSQYNGPLFTQPSQYGGPLFTQASQSYPTSPPESLQANDEDPVTTEPATSENEEPLFTQANSHTLRPSQTSPSQLRPDTSQRLQSTPRPLRELVSTRTAESVIKALSGFLKEVDQTRKIIRQSEEEERRRQEMEQQTEAEEDGDSLRMPVGEPLVEKEARERGSPVPVLVRKRSEFASVESLKSRGSAAGNSEKEGRRPSHSRNASTLQPSSSGERMSRAVRLGKQKGELLQRSGIPTDADSDSLPHFKAARQSDARRSHPTATFDSHAPSSLESRSRIYDHGAREKHRHAPLDLTTKQSSSSISSLRDMNIAGPSKHTRYEEYEILSNPDPFAPSSSTRPSLSHLQPDYSKPSRKGKGKAVTVVDPSSYDTSRRRYTLDSAEGSNSSALGPELDLRTLAPSKRTSRHSLPSRLSVSSTSSLPPPQTSFVNSSSSSPIKLSASDQSKLVDANVERMAREYNFPPDYVRHIWKETEDLNEAEDILRELRNMSATLLHRSRRRSSAIRQVKGDSPREMGSVRSASRDVDARTARHLHHRQRVSEKFTLKVTDQGFESDYSPPAVSRAGQLVRLTEQGRVEEALEREKRRATIGNGTLIVQPHEGQRSRIRSSESPAARSSDDAMTEDPKQTVRDRSHIMEELLDTEDLDKLFFSNPRSEDGQRAQDLAKLHGSDLMIELAVRTLSK